ncbi:MAG: YceI family protein [Amphiplicatus sp.]
MRRLIMVPALAAAVLAFGCSQGGSEATAAQSADSKPAPAAETGEADFSGAPSGTYVTDYKHRYITFSYFHQGYSHPFLRWRDWTGELTWNAENPAASSIDVVIDAESIDSGVDEFDGHLKGEGFFDVANHPEITFVSTSVETTGATTGKVTGDLTIKGITKPVTLDVTFNKADAIKDGNKIGFSAKGVVKRSDYGVDKHVPYVSDDVEVIIEAELVSSAS